MSLLFKYTVTGKNYTYSERNGKRSETAEDITFQGQLQPLSSRDIVSITAGRLSSGMLRVFSEEELIIPTEGVPSKGKGTYVLYRGKWYECVSAAEWQSNISELEEIDHFEYLAEYRGLATGV